MSHWLDIIGVGEGGIADLPPPLQRLIAIAPYIIGPDRFAGQCANFVSWTAPFAAMLNQLDQRRGQPCVVLASGDPMWYGIGASLARRYGQNEFTIHPHVSAFQLAAAKLYWPLQNLATISLHGRPPSAIHPHILPGNRILALTSAANTAQHVAKILVARGYGRSSMLALEHLGGAKERISQALAKDFDATKIGDFYVLAIDCVASTGAALLPPVPGLPDAAFISDGQLTKRDVRAATLAKLAPFPGALLWDIGAGSGSIAIEFLRAARNAKAIAFEQNPQRCAMIATNAEALGAPHLQIEPGDALTNLVGKPAPDAVFIGGDVGNVALFDACWAAMPQGALLVANAVTLEGEQNLYDHQALWGGELLRLDIATLDQIGRHRALRPRMAVTQYVVQKS